MVGFIGSHLQQSFAAIGDVTNTASRLESKTRDYPGCDILISQSTEEVQQRQGVAETTYLGQASSKGKEQKVPVYQVLGPRIAGTEMSGHGPPDAHSHHPVERTLFFRVLMTETGRAPTRIDLGDSTEMRFFDDRT